MKRLVLTLSKNEFEEKNGKLYHKVLKREEFDDENPTLELPEKRRGGPTAKSVDIEYPKDYTRRAIELLNTGMLYREVCDVLTSEGYKTKQGYNITTGVLSNKIWYLRKKRK